MIADLSPLKQLVEDWRAEAASHPRGYGDGHADICDRHADALDAAIGALEPKL